MRAFTDSEVLRAVEKTKNFPGWGSVGVVDVWIRSKADAYNRFDDKVFTYDARNTGDGGTPGFIMGCTGTSNPGAGALQNFMRYNRKGAAVVKSGVFNLNSHKHGRHKRDYNSYRQAKGIPHHRDGNRNRRIDEVGPVYTTIQWLNVHKAGIFSKLIGWWSAGCLVRNQRRQWNRWIGWMNKQGNPRLSTVVLQEGKHI